MEAPPAGSPIPAQGVKNNPAVAGRTRRERSPGAILQVDLGVSRVAVFDDERGGWNEQRSDLLEV
jgi:hypothetical protein